LIWNVIEPELDVVVVILMVYDVYAPPPWEISTVSVYVVAAGDETVNVPEYTQSPAVMALTYMVPPEAQVTGLEEAV
jgi:hypothetical protein